MQDDMGLKGKITKGMAREHFNINKLLELEFYFRFKTKMPPIIQIWGPTGSGKSTDTLALMLKWCAINKVKFYLKLMFDDAARMFDEVLGKVDYPYGTPFASDEGDDKFGGMNTAVETLDWKNLEKRVRALGYPIFYAAPNLMAHQYHFVFETDGLLRNEDLSVKAGFLLVHDSDNLLRGSLALPAPRKDVLDAYFSIPKAQMMDKEHLRNISKTSYLNADEYVKQLVADGITCEGRHFDEMKNFNQKLWFIVKTSKYRTKAMANYIISGYEMQRPPEEEKPKPKKLSKEEKKLLKKVKGKKGKLSKKERELRDIGWKKDPATIAETAASAKKAKEIVESNREPQSQVKEEPKDEHSQPA